MLKEINKAGIYLLVDKLEKRCYVNYSSNISGSLNRLLSSNLFFAKYEFEILEIVTEPMNLRIRCQYFKDLYSSNGYEIINPKRVSSWKVFIEPINDFRFNTNKNYLFAVKLSSRGYKELTVGIFSTYVEVDEFINKFYARNIVTDIKYSNNKLTTEYLKLND